MSEPKRGMLFEHSRHITGSPKAGTAKPVTYVVSKVTATSVYFKEPGAKASQFVVSRDKFSASVRRVQQS